MMPDDPGFLAAILADPADDLPRLAYADWLEEHGSHALAEFIRVQCELAKTPEVVTRSAKKNVTVGDKVYLNPRYRLLQNRVVEMLDTHGHIWTLSLHQAIGDWSPVRQIKTPFYPTFRRGFVEELTCAAVDWLNHADAILAVQPIRRVTLTTPPLWQTVKYGYGRLAGRTRSHWINCVEGNKDMRSTEVKLLTQEWPGIQFNVDFPAARNADLNALLIQLQDVAPSTRQRRSSGR